MRCFLKIGVLTFGMMLLTGSTVHAENRSLLVDRYTLTKTERLGPHVYKHTYKSRMTNTGNNASNISAKLVSTSPAVTAVDGLLDFGDLAAGYSASSNDTFSIRYDSRKGELDLESLSWDIHATQAADVVWPRINNPVNKNVDARIKKLLEHMTTEEKVGQMIMGEIQATRPEDVSKFNLGAILNGGGSWPGNNKNAAISDWVKLADSYWLASIDTRDGGVGIPVMWGTDAVHGHGNVIGATIFPHNIGLGAANNPDLVRRISEATAKEVAVTGIDWVFAPAVSTVRDDRWGRTYEGYSEDPEIVRRYAGAVIEGLQGKAGSPELFSPGRVLTTAKHFIGDGGTLNGDDQGNVMVSEQALHDIHAQGYFSAIGAGTQIIMATFNSWNDMRVHGNHYLLTEVLKNRMGFDGFVLGDWNGHGQVPGCSYNDCSQVILAGVDMMMVPYEWQEFYENTLKQVQGGVIPMSRIDDAVSRILRVKLRAGLFEKPRPSKRKFANKTDLLASTKHRALARQAARESFVLLKNNQQLLPLNPKTNVLVAGRGSDNISMQCGGWTVSWQGTGHDNEDFPQGTSILEGIQSAVERAGGQLQFSETGIIDSTNKPDVAIVVIGETPYAEYLGDAHGLEHQRIDKIDWHLLKQLQSENIPVVTVFLSGRPRWVNKELNASDAFIAAWLPGTEGGSIADVIFTTNDGKIRYDFKGRLAYSWPKRADQFHLNRHDEDYDPLFSFGFGLDYSKTTNMASSLDETNNTVHVHSLRIPGIIEAEHFRKQFGTLTENTKDEGGGQHLTRMNAGDWVDYELDIGATGIYRMFYRVASPNGSAGFEVLLDGVKIDQQEIKKTGSWQNWVTNETRSKVNLPAGKHILRINAIEGGWNLNRIELHL